MKKIICFLLILNLLNCSCLCSTNADLKKKIKDFCFDYYCDVSKIKASKLDKMIKNEDLLKYQVGDDLNCDPNGNKINYYIISDDFEFKNLEKIMNSKVFINGKMRNTDIYSLDFEYTILYGFNIECKKRICKGNYWIAVYKNSFKIYGDNMFSNQLIRESDIPILKQSLLNRK